MHGSITLDFILSLVIVLASASSFFYLAYTQVENTVIASAQYKAEAMAMQIGSAINHFAAIQPEKNSYMELNFTGLPESNGTASFGVPGFSVDIPEGNCTVVFNGVNNTVTVSMLAYRMESSQPEEIIAVYPTAEMSNSALDGKLQVPCNGTVKVSSVMGVSKL